MPNTITGKILSIGQTVNVSTQKEFLKRELVLDCTRYDQYTGEPTENFVKMSFTQKRCEELNGYQAGELVEVSFILNGRKYEKNGETKYITDIIGYKVERKGAQQGAQAPQAAQAPSAPQPIAEPTAAAPQTAQTDNEPLPF